MGEEWRLPNSYASRYARAWSDRVDRKGNAAEEPIVCGEPIARQPEYDALHAFDAENNVEPTQTIARRLVDHYFGIALVDAISNAIEDARDLGERRVQFIPKRRP
jgi:hypothetical protein